MLALRVLPVVSQRMATVALLVAALGHAALSLILWSHGHAPSSTWLPESWHYLIQALLAGPLYFAQWHVLSRVVSRVLLVERADVHSICGWVLGTSTLGLLVVPDFVLYWQGGIEALRWGAPAVLSSLFLGSSFWLTLRLRKRLPAQRWYTVIGASVIGLVAQALVGALIIR